MKRTVAHVVCCLRLLFEIRSNLSDGKIARVLFGIAGGGLVLLHGFIKKTQATPQPDLELARKRLREIE